MKNVAMVRAIVIPIILPMMITIVVDMEVIAVMIMPSRISMMIWIQACSTTFNLVISLTTKDKIS